MCTCANHMLCVCTTASIPGNVHVDATAPTTPPKRLLPPSAAIQPRPPNCSHSCISPPVTLSHCPDLLYATSARMRTLAKLRLRRLTAGASSGRYSKGLPYSWVAAGQHHKQQCTSQDMCVCARHRSANKRCSVNTEPCNAKAAFGGGQGQMLFVFTVSKCCGGHCQAACGKIRHFSRPHRPPNHACSQQHLPPSPAKTPVLSRE